MNLGDPIILHEPLLGGVIVSGRELMNLIHVGQGHRSQFRGEVQLILEVAVIERFDPDGVASQHKIIAVEDGKGEHSVQFLYTFRPLRLVKTQNGLGVGFGLEPILGGQFPSELAKVIDFAVTDDPYPPFVGQDRLMPSSHIDDG